MKKILFLACLLSPMLAGSIALADCTPSQDMIGQAEVANLRSQADAADMRAQMSTNANLKAQNEMAAQNFRSQADNLERQQQIIAQGAQEMCNTLSNDGH